MKGIEGRIYMEAENELPLLKDRQPPLLDKGLDYIISVLSE